VLLKFQKSSLYWPFLRYNETRFPIIHGKNPAFGSYLGICRESNTLIREIGASSKGLFGSNGIGKENQKISHNLHIEMANWSKLKKLSKDKTTIMTAIGIVIGVTFGLVYGYLINPVEWVDASMEAAREDIQEDYLRMAIDSYTINQDATAAVQRWDALGGAGRETLKRVVENPAEQGLEAVNRFEGLVIPKDNIASNKTCDIVCASCDTTTCQVLWGMTLVFVAGLGVYFYQRTKPKTVRAKSTSLAGVKVWDRLRKFPTTSRRKKPRVTRVADKLDPPPLANFMCTYTRGNKDFDETYSIDSKDGEFLGECGVELVKTSLDDSGEKPSVFDIWLFDKNEINTQSIILMSSKAFSDDVLKKQLKTRGKPLKAVIGEESYIQTDHLLMKFRIVDMICSKGDTGQCDTFTRLSIDINIW